VAVDEQIDELEERVLERTRELEETHSKLQEAQTRLIQELEAGADITRVTADLSRLGVLPPCR